MNDHVMKKYTHISERKIPIYRGTLIIILSNDSQKVSDKINYSLDEVYAHSFIVDWHGMEGFLCLLNLHSKQRKIYHGTIAHEASHLAHFILQERGVKEDFENDEPVAYLVEWITDEIYKEIKKKKLTHRIA